MAYFNDEEYPGLARYQRAKGLLNIANYRCATAAKLYVDAKIPLRELKIELAKLEAADKELNDANFCYTHPERAHERQ